jgi:glycosyltransferase involved in cell wall biosynthesis
VQTQVIIPTYNERENIAALVTTLIALPMPLGVIIVDDNSPDGTGQLVDSLAAEHNQVTAIHRPGKLGLGTAHIAGMKRALELGADYVLTMDADFSHHPRFIPAMVARMDSCDLCIGSRYVPGGGTIACTAPRKALSYGANAFARLALGLQAHDCTAGFRCYRRQILEQVPLDRIFSNGYSFLIEMLYLCQKAGARVAEIPIIFENRRLGQSKISRREIASAMYTVLRLAPSRFFAR